MEPSSSTAAAPALRWLGLGTLTLFVACLIVEHVAVSRLSPATHQISEYADDSRTGWLMTVGFLGWAVSLAAAAELVRRARPRPRVASAAVVWCLRLACAGMLITAIFHTQTLAGALPPGVQLRAAGRLHDLGSGLTTLAIALAAGASLLCETFKRPVFHQATGAGLTLAIATDIALLLVGSSVGGIRERILVAIGCLWQAGLLVVSDRPCEARRGSGVA